MTITIHRTERYLSDKSAVSGRVADYVSGWSFARPESCDHVDDRGLVGDQDLDPGVSIRVDAPAGSVIAETTGGTPALFMTGNPIGLDASAVVSLARARRDGFSIIKD